MRKDSPLLQYYYKHLPKAVEGQQTTGCPKGYYYNTMFKTCLPINELTTLPQKEQAQLKASNKPIPKDKNYGKKVDPYETIIAKETAAKQSERNQDLAKRAGISAAAAAAIVSGGAALPYLAPALETTIAGVPGLTAGNILNAGFAYQGAKNVPSVYNAWKNVVNKPTWSGAGNAAAETVVTGLDMLPFGMSAAKGVPSVIQDINQAKGLFNKPKATPFNFENAFQNLQLQGYPSAAPTQNLDLEELRRVYHNTERILQPEEARFLHKHGHGLQSQYLNTNSRRRMMSELIPGERSIAPRQNIDTRTQAQNVIDRFSQPSPEQAQTYATLRDQSGLFRKPSPGGMFNAPPVRTGNTLFGMTPEEVNARWGNYSIDTSPSIWESSFSATAKPTNRSGMTMDQVLTTAKDKDVVSKMTEDQFKQTVVKPTGEVVPYKPGTEISEMSYDLANNRVMLNDAQQLSPDEYAEQFNSRLDLLNDIISKNNKSGVEYSVTGLTPGGQLKFTGPTGESSWSVGINPGQWRGQVQDIPNTEYFKSIPGLDMRNTTSSVFGDRTARRGTGAYDSINEYLKALDLGRVKAGFNSQSSSSKPLWENAVKSGKAFGFYSNPSTVHGVMRTLVPMVGAGAIGADVLSQRRNGGDISIPELTTKMPALSLGGSIQMRPKESPLLNYYLQRTKGKRMIR